MRNGEFIIEDGVLVKYVGTDKNVVVPSEVVTIGEGAFEGNKKMESVDLNGVTLVCKRAFHMCNALIDAVAKNAVTVEEEAFRFCGNLRTVRFGAVERIGKGSFIGCHSLDIVTGLENVLYIEYEAFGGCDIAEIKLGERICEIGPSAFRCCDKLRKIVIPEGIEELSGCAFAGCTLLCDVTLPQSLRVIRRAAFFETKIRLITIPPNVTEIEPEAFARCHIAHIFNMSELNIKTGKNSNGGIAMHALNVYTPSKGSDTSENIDGFIFVTDAKNDEVRLVDYVGSKRELVLPRDYHGRSYIINRLVFEQCNITSADIGDGVTAIGNLAFFECKQLAHVELGSSIKSIDRLAFKCCKKLKAIVIKDGVERIGSGAFLATGLEYIVLPRSVTDIKSSVFDYTMTLKKIYYTGTPEELDATNIGGGEKNIYKNRAMYYSEAAPTDTEHKYWRYVNGAIVEW